MGLEKGADINDVSCLTTNWVKLDQAVVSNYWLNEIKSQEDTARQIMTICIFMLGASITLITGNFASISKFINSAFLNKDLNIQVIAQYLAMGMYLFLFVWIFALLSARKSLSVEPLLSGKSLSEIANKKNMHCKYAIGIIAVGMRIVVVIFIILLMLQFSFYYLIIPVSFFAVIAIMVQLEIMEKFEKWLRKHWCK